MWLQTCRCNIIIPILCPEDGISVLLRNVGNHQPARFQPRSNKNETLPWKRAVRPTPGKRLRTAYNLSADRGMNLYYRTHNCIAVIPRDYYWFQEAVKFISFHTIRYYLFKIILSLLSEPVFVPASLKCFLSWKVPVKNVGFCYGLRACYVFRPSSFPSYTHRYTSMKTVYMN
jgi:hypothetical protein